MAEDAPKEIPGFKLNALREIIKQHFNADTVSVVYLTEGGFHSIYDCHMTSASGASLPRVVARIAFPVFPRDKVASEVATLKYIARHTSVPVPHVYAWDNDASGPVGAEYMLLEKILGKPAVEIYDQLTFHQRLRATEELATHLSALYHLRFPTIGSIYMSSPSIHASHKSEFTIGPLVSMTYFDEYDAHARQPNLTADRGPWQTAGEWLVSIPAAELTWIEGNMLEELDRGIKEWDIDPEDVHERMRSGRARLHELMKIASIYSGVPDDESLSPYTFSLRHHDFRQSNFMINEHTGRVTGLIDFEATGTAPLWACAQMPSWLEPTDVGGWPVSSPADAAERAALRKAFLDVVDRLDEHNGPETRDCWRGAYERGSPFQFLLGYCQMGCVAQSGMSEALLGVLEWAKSHPGQTATFPIDF